MISRRILVTGGAGYIGSHTAKVLASNGFVPITYDNFAAGHRWAVRSGPLVEGDIADKTKVLDTIRRYEISAVIHFAAFAYVGESMSNPQRYFDNNVTKSLALLDALLEGGVQHLVFSSSCATYGIPSEVPIRESTPQIPVNPYGETKLIIEKALKWYGAAHDLKWIALRYFNAAGADPEGGLGEVHSPETHLIPLVIRAAMESIPVEVYGDDYPTADGTCVRDYVHVSDLAEAHVQALEYLQGGGKSLAMNLGTGVGVSVKQIIDAVRELIGKEVPHCFAPRRSGDPASLVADPSLANDVLGWRPRHSALESIISTAWKWHSKYSTARVE